MKIGVVQIIDGLPGRGLDFAAETASVMEELGFHSYWAPDHALFFDSITSSYPHSESGEFGFRKDQGILDPLMVLQAAAKATSALRIGTSVEVITLRNPVVRSKHVATLDQFSGGRLDYGVGIGWMKEEYEAVGVPWEGRADRADEYIQAMKALWTQHRSAFDGKFVSFSDVVAFPKPVQNPHPPILVGGISRGAIKRAAKFGDGWYGWKMTLDELDGAIDMLREELSLVGRSLDDGFKLMLGTPHFGDTAEVVDFIMQLKKRGISEFVLGLSLSRSRMREQLESYARTVVSVVQ